MARGYIRKRGVNRWQLVYDVPRGPDGKRQQRYETVRGNKKEAQARLTQLLESLRRGQFIEPSQIAVGEYLTLWMDDYVTVNLKPRTIEGYAAIIRRHIVPILGHIRLRDLAPHQISRFYGDKLRSGLTARTVLNFHRMLHRALEHAVDWQLIERNPADRVSLPRPTMTTARSFEAEEIPHLLEAFQSTPYFVPVQLGLYLGLRRGEVLGLRWQDIDFDARVLTVERTMHYVPGRGYLWGEPKSRGSRRVLSIPETTALVLRAHRERRHAELMQLGIPVLPGDQVVSQADGRLMKPNGLSHGFKRVATRAGFDLRFHDLRHTHATLLLSAGTPMPVVKDRMGHQSIATTVDTYGHVVASADVEASATFDSLVGRMWAEVADSPG